MKEFESFELEKLEVSCLLSCAYPGAQTFELQHLSSLQSSNLSNFDLQTFKLQPFKHSSSKELARDTIRFLHLCCLAFLCSSKGPLSSWASEAEASELLEGVLVHALPKSWALGLSGSCAGGLPGLASRSRSSSMGSFCLGSCHNRQWQLLRTSRHVGSCVRTQTERFGCVSRSKSAITMTVTGLVPTTLVLARTLNIIFQSSEFPYTFHCYALGHTQAGCPDICLKASKRSESAGGFHGQTMFST